MKEMMIEISARHAHLTQEAVEILFGKGHTLTLKKELSQPGQYACEEKIIVKGPRNELKMSVLGPVRNVNQIEISLIKYEKVLTTVSEFKAVVKEN